MEHKLNLLQLAALCAKLLEESMSCFVLHKGAAEYSPVKGSKTYELLMLLSCSLNHSTLCANCSAVKKGLTGKKKKILLSTTVAFVYIFENGFVEWMIKLWISAKALP